MGEQRPLIGIQADVFLNGQAPFHGVGEKYINAVIHGSQAQAMLIPGLSFEQDGRELQQVDDNYLRDLISRLDGLILPGSPSNLNPQHYHESLLHPDSPADPQRDATSLRLIRLAIEQGVPLFAVCRGFRELNVALGGSLYQAVHEQPGLMDHREDKHASRAEQYAPAHEVTLVANGLLASWLSCTRWKVNSLHGQGVKQLAPVLRVEARADDGLIEAVSLPSAAALVVAVQWHPEWQFADDALSSALFHAFGEAARLRRAQRLATSGHS